MALAAKFKFSDRTLPWALEQKLIFKYGFRTASRAPSDYVIMEKIKVITGARRTFNPPTRQEQSTPANGKMTELDQTLLRRQLNAVVAMFLHPEQHLDKIKARLHNIKQIQPPGEKVKFVEDWITAFLTEIGDR